MPKQHLGDIVKLDDSTSAERKTGIKNTSILIKDGDGQSLPRDIDGMLKETETMLIHTVGELIRQWSLEQEG